MNKSYTKIVKNEISKHVSKNFEFNFVKASYDISEVKKDLRKKFIDCGMLYNPHKLHHLEFRFKNLKTANLTVQELAVLDVTSKISFNADKNVAIVYITDAKNIMKTLKILGANETLKEYKDIYEYNIKAKDTNRLVNFETSNIKRSSEAALYQIDLIERLLKKRKIDSLDEDLRIVIKARMKYKLLSMNDLAKKIGNITKSAINHRFLKIKKLVGD